jgi:hypothetical protein
LETQITAANDAELLTKEYVHKVGKRFLAERKSRKEMTNYLTDIYCAWAESGGIVFDRAGRVIEIHEDIVDDAYQDDRDPDDDDDQWARSDAIKWHSWNTDVKAFATKMPLRNPKKSLLKRLRMIEMAFKIIGQPII